MKKILITGGAGFIGSHLAEKMSEKYKVIIIDNLMHGSKLKKNKNIQLVKGDIRNYNLVKKYSKNCSTIFHLAAILGVDIVSDRNIETMECEFIGLKNICDAAKDNKVKKIIYSSSSGVYGKINFKKNVKEDIAIAPVSAYALAKRAGEIYLKNFYKETNITTIAVRLFNVYGPRQDDRMVIPRFIAQAKKNKKITVYDSGNQTRDFTYISDCIKVFSLLHEKKINEFQILNSSRGSEMKIISLAKEIIKLTGSSSKIVNLKVPKKIKEFQVPKRCGNSSKLKNLIHYKPSINIKDGLRKTVTYYKKI